MWELHVSKENGKTCTQKPCGRKTWHKFIPKSIDLWFQCPDPHFIGTKSTKPLFSFLLFLPLPFPCFLPPPLPPPHLFNNKAQTYEGFQSLLLSVPSPHVLSTENWNFCLILKCRRAQQRLYNCSEFMQLLENQLFTRVDDNRTRGNDIKLQERRFRLDAQFPRSSFFQLRD